MSIPTIPRDQAAEIATNDMSEAEVPIYDCLTARVEHESERDGEAWLVIEWRNIADKRTRRMSCAIPEQFTPARLADTLQGLAIHLRSSTP